MTRPPLTNKATPEALDEMVRSLMAGGSVKASFVDQAQRFIDGAPDYATEAHIATQSRRLSAPRWWKEFLGQYGATGMAEAERALGPLLMAESPTDPGAVRALAQRLKDLISQKRRAVSADLLLTAAKDYTTEPGNPEFHLQRFGADLHEDLALASQLCDAVVRVNDPRIVENVYRFLTDEARCLLGGAGLVSVLADRVLGAK